MSRRWISPAVSGRHERAAAPPVAEPRRTRAPAGLLCAGAAALAALALCGCSISRNIVDLTPPPNRPDLRRLEEHLDYADPDAGRPTYVRTTH